MYFCFDSVVSDIKHLARITECQHMNILKEGANPVAHLNTGLLGEIGMFACLHIRYKSDTCNLFVFQLNFISKQK